MTTAKEILKLVPTIQSVQLANENLKLVNKKKKTSNDFMKMGVKNIFSTSLIKAEADLIGELD